MARVLVVMLLAVVAVACSSGASASPDASAAEGPGIPVACLGLDQPDCMRAYQAAAAARAPDVEVVYAEVGPFGCPNETGCPNSLVGRPSGQVVFERATGEPVAISVTAAADGTITTAPTESFTVVVEPTSLPGQLRAEPIPYSLGHCGLGSGVDVDGSWWDPVGFVDIDHGDAINAAEGTFTPHDPNHATFVSDGDFEVSLVRRVGEKHLPMCM
jgi:hypothetical protein